MRLIGVLGGTSWPSTILPYRLLNQEVHRRLGGNHSARIALYSIDYHEIRSGYSGDWGKVPDLLLGEIKTLLSFKPDCWMIANNTLHKVYGQIRHELPADPPMFHAVELVRDDLLARGARKVLLLGTRFTMEDDYYAGCAPPGLRSKFRPRTTGSGLARSRWNWRKAGPTKASPIISRI
jgi:aspartate racemase